MDFADSPVYSVLTPGQLEQELTPQRQASDRVATKKLNWGGGGWLDSAGIWTMSLSHLMWWP